MNRDYWESMRERPMIEKAFDRMETRLEKPNWAYCGQDLSACFDCTRNDCKECLNGKNKNI